MTSYRDSRYPQELRDIIHVLGHGGYANLAETAKAKNKIQQMLNNCTTPEISKILIEIINNNKRALANLDKFTSESEIKDYGLPSSEIMQKVDAYVKQSWSR